MVGDVVCVQPPERKACGAPHYLSLRPCVLALGVVYVGVTTRTAMAESTEYAYERAFEAHWTDVFRFALAWTNDWSEA